MDITRKYENTLKDVDYYRKQERAAYTALQNLRMQYEEVSLATCWNKSQLTHETDLMFCNSKLTKCFGITCGSVSSQWVLILVVDKDFLGCEWKLC